MANINIIRKKTMLFQNLKTNFSGYWKTFFVMLVLVVIACVTGCITVFRFTGTVDSDLITDQVLKFLVGSDAVFWNVLFSRLFCSLLLMLLLFVTSLSTFAFIINYSVLIYLWYVVGVNIGVVINLLNVKGVVFVVFVYIPLTFALLLAILLVNSILICCCIKKKKYGCYNKSCLDCIKLLVLIMFAVIIFQSIVYPLFNNLFILT